MVLKRCKIAVDWGHQFFPKESRSSGDLRAVEAGKTDCHIRLNLATSEAYVRLAAERLVEALKR